MTNPSPKTKSERAAHREEHNANTYFKQCILADTNNYILYYIDASDQTLKRRISPGTATQVVARYVTNQLAFRTEDFAGNVLTNNQNSRVLKMTLEFYQWEFAVLQAGGGNFADYYRLQTKVARRATQ